MKPAEVRNLVIETLLDLGFPNPEARGERILCKNDYFVGIGFDFEEISAIWIIESGEVKFINDSRQVLKVVSVIQEPQSTRLAA